MATTAMQTAASPTSARVMGANVPTGLPRLHKPRPLALSVRVAQKLGCKPAAAEARMYGPHAANRECAAIIEAYFEAGDPEGAAAYASPVEAVMNGRPTDALDDVLHDAEVADCMEQLADESFRHKRRLGTATLEDAREFIRKSAVARRKAEAAEAALLDWIKSEEAK